MNTVNIKKIKGPIIVFGAGGFIGINLLLSLLRKRSDVYGVFQNPDRSWRLQKSGILKKHVINGNLLDPKQIEKIIKKLKPQTIFNLAAYGAYAKQTDVQKIYAINVSSTVHLLETLKKLSFSAYIHAGSQSEYGLNADAPSESDELVPNSHYAVSKTADFYLLKYYGKIEKLPVIHTRLYSAYGPYEEPDRLIPTLIKYVQKGTLPPFVNPTISRDFIYVDDVCNALITLAAQAKKKHFGEAYNIATGTKTTIKDLASLAQKLFTIQTAPIFGTMKNRHWDVSDWVGNPTKMKKAFGWHSKVALSDGLKKMYDQK